MASSKTTSPRFALPDSNIRTPGDGVSNGFLQQEIMRPYAANPVPGLSPAKPRGLAGLAAAARQSIRGDGYRVARYTHK